MPEPEEEEEGLIGGKKKEGGIQLPSCCPDKIPGNKPAKIFTGVCLYYLIGYLIFHNHPDLGWDMVTSFYFISISITTVG